MSQHTSDDETEQAPFKRAGRLLYRHSTTAISLSIIWVLASVPIVTIGPATLGLYAAVRSLREKGLVDWSQVYETVHANLVHATLLGLAPPVFVGVGILYLFAPNAMPAPVAVLSVYAGVFLWVVLVPAFIEMSAGADPVDAVTYGYVWVAKRPAVGVRLVLATGILFIVSLVLSIAFVLLFPATMAVYHVVVVADDPDETSVTYSNTRETNDFLATGALSHK